jgi:hypothetical protein
MRAGKEGGKATDPLRAWHMKPTLRFLGSLGRIEDSPFSEQYKLETLKLNDKLGAEVSGMSLNLGSGRS